VPLPPPVPAAASTGAQAVRSAAAKDWACFRAAVAGAVLTVDFEGDEPELGVFGELDDPDAPDPLAVVDVVLLVDALWSAARVA